MVDPDSGHARDAVPVGRQPNSIALDSSAAWVANGGSGTVTRIDASTLATSTIGGFQSPPYALATGAGRVWATEETAGLASVDVTTQTASAPSRCRRRVGSPTRRRASPTASARSGSAAAFPTASTLLRIDPSTERIVVERSRGLFREALDRSRQDGVWVSDQLDNRVVEVDPKTMRIERRVSIGGPTAIAVGGGSLWVCGADDNGVWRLQARNGYRSPTLIPTGAEPVAVAIGQGAVWAAVADGTLARIDPATNAVGSTQDRAHAQRRRRRARRRLGRDRTDQVPLRQSAPKLAP